MSKKNEKTYEKNEKVAEKNANADKLEDILKKLIAAKTIADMCIEDIPFFVRPGFEINKIQAAEEVKSLTQELSSLLVPTMLAALFVEGDKKAVEDSLSFIDNNGGLAIKADAIYRNIAKEIEPSFGVKRSFDTTQLGILTYEYRKLALDAGYDEVLTPMYSETICPNEDSTTAHVRDIIRDVIGDELNAKILTKEILNAVISRNLVLKVIPVLIAGWTEKELPELSKIFIKTSRVNLSAGYEPTQESITTFFHNPT